MRKILITLILCLLTATFCYSQSTLNQSYPQKISFNGDTVIAITVDQMKKVNLDILELNKLRIETSLLKESLIAKDSTIKQLQFIYSQTLKQDSLSQIQVSYFKDIISLQDSKYQDMKASFYEQNQLLKKQLRKTNIKSGLIQSGIIVALILLPVILLK